MKTDDAEGWIKFVYLLVLWVPRFFIRSHTPFFSAIYWHNFVIPSFRPSLWAAPRRTYSREIKTHVVLLSRVVVWNMLNITDISVPPPILGVAAGRLWARLILLPSTRKMNVCDDVAVADTECCCVWRTFPILSSPRCCSCCCCYRHHSSASTPGVAPPEMSASGLSNAFQKRPTRRRIPGDIFHGWIGDVYIRCVVLSD